MWRAVSDAEDMAIAVGDAEDMAIARKASFVKARANTSAICRHGWIRRTPFKSAYIVMAYVVMVCIVMAYVVMAYIVMAV